MGYPTSQAMKAMVKTFGSLCKELQKKIFQQRCEFGRIGR